jgi:hypothetical protein
MKRGMAPKTGVMLALTLAGAALGAAAPAAGADPNLFDGNWHYSVTPYLWLPNINAKLNYDIPGQLVKQFATQVGPNDYLENLKFAIMLTGDVRKGNWSAFTDIIYIDMGNEDTRVRTLTGPRGREWAEHAISASTSMSAAVWTLAGAYTAYRDPAVNLDLFLGFRYLGLDTDLQWQVADDTLRERLHLNRYGSFSDNRDYWDGIVGVKGMVHFGKTDWFMPYYLDIGAGDSDLTWQALLGLGYHFNWGDVSLSIRSLSYQFNEGNTDLRLTGPALGFSFRW